MQRRYQNLTGLGQVAAGLALMLGSATALATVDGISGATSFAFTAKGDSIATGEGGVLHIWGLADGAGRAQYPAPTLILNQGDVVTITLTNQLPVPTSLIFPGQGLVVASGTHMGLLTQEAAPGGSVSYSFTAEQPGTYVYHSGTSPELQIEMGLVGAIIVRPAGFNASAPTAYGVADSAYDREYLFLMTEMDPRIHEVVRFGGVAALAATDYLSKYQPNYWFFNGRTAPDTMYASNLPYLPTQPYSCMPMMHPGEKVLVRGIGGGRDLHPLHLHGNHFRIFAKDGRLLQSAPGQGADLATSEYTHASIPGETFDAIYEWTGEDLGWDIYGTGPGFDHACLPDLRGFDLITHEYCADHGKPIPVDLPALVTTAAGGYYSGSPFLGGMDMLKPGEGGMNPMGAFTYMWHSHQEKDLVNHDTFPGGMMTMLMVVPPGALIP